MTISRSIHVAANGIISFFFYVWWYSIIYIHHILFTHSSVDGHLACFCVLDIVKSAAVNIGVYASFQIIVFSGYMPKRGTAGSHASLFLVF